MLDTYAISRLYANVLYYDIEAYRIPPEKIRAAIQAMAKVYKPESTSFQAKSPLNANFNDIAHRYAYLHKYAPLHTYIVLDVMGKILKQEMLLFRKLVKSKEFEFCCLGGGPGSDVIGVLAALYAEFSSCRISATIVDSMQDWESTFMSVTCELIGRNYGKPWSNLAKYFRWNYIGADLIRELTNEVTASIASSSLVTMIKFLSAAVCKNTEEMVENIFNAMMPGSLLLFIDNAGGGFSQLIQKVAEESGFSILVELRHVPYKEEIFNVTRFGYHACCSTTVTIFLLQKPMNRQSKISLVSLGCKAEIVDERTPLLHGKKVKKTSSRKHLQTTKLKIAQESPTNVSLVGDKDSRSIGTQMLKITSSPKPLQELQISNTSNSAPQKDGYSKTENGNLEPLPTSPLSHTESKNNSNLYKKIVNPIKFQLDSYLKSVPTSEFQQTYASKAGQKLINTSQTDFKASSLQGISIPNYSSITPPPASIAGINYNSNSFYFSKQNIPQRTIVCSETPLPVGCRKTNPYKLPLQEKTLNTNLQQVDSKTSSLAKQKENNSLHHNSLQGDKNINFNSLNSDGITVTRSDALQKTFLKESTSFKTDSIQNYSPIATLPVPVQEISCQGLALPKTAIPTYPLITEQPVAVAGADYNARSPRSKQSMFRGNVDGFETSSEDFNTRTYRNFSQTCTVMPSLHKQNINKPLPQTSLQEIQISPSSSPTFLSPSIHAGPTTVQQTSSERGTSRKQIIPNYSSITTQPVSITGINNETSHLPEPYIPPSDIDDSEGGICCPCWQKQNKHLF